MKCVDYNFKVYSNSGMSNIKEEEPHLNIHWGIISSCIYGVKSELMYSNANGFHALLKPYSVTNTFKL